MVLWQGINQAAAVRLGIDVQTYGPVVEFREIQDLVHRFSRVYSSWHRSVNFESVGWLKPAIPGLVILLDHSKILDPKPADRYSHPAVLILMVVDS